MTYPGRGNPPQSAESHYLKCQNENCERFACLARRDYEHRLASACRKLDVAIGALDGLHAETKIGMDRCMGVIFSGLEQGISTVPNSLPHGNLKFHMPRINKALDMASSALVQIREGQG